MDHIVSLHVNIVKAKHCRGKSTMNYFILGALRVLSMGYHMSFCVHRPKTGLEKPGAESDLLILLTEIKVAGFALGEQ